MEFTKEGCQVFDRSNKCVMEGRRLSNNCYLLGVGETTSPTTCMISKSDDMNFWHGRMKHLHFKAMKKITTGGLVRGIPELKG